MKCKHKGKLKAGGSETKERIYTGSKLQVVGGDWSAANFGGTQTIWAVEGGLWSKRIPKFRERENRKE